MRRSAGSHVQIDTRSLRIFDGLMLELLSWPDAADRLWVGPLRTRILPFRSRMGSGFSAQLGLSFLKGAKHDDLVRCADELLPGKARYTLKNIVSGTNDAAMIRARIEDFIKAEGDLASSGGAFDGLRHDLSFEAKVCLNSRAAELRKSSGQPGRRFGGVTGIVTPPQDHGRE